MDDREAIPFGDVGVAVPDHVRERLRAVAERRLQHACDLAFWPDARDAVIAAVHVLDAFEEERLTPKIVLVLLPELFDEALTNDGVDLAQELIDLRNAMQEACT